ncbi:N-alpha-acetyltransferase 60-like, partial [Globisporangium splendens]
MGGEAGVVALQIDALPAPPSSLSMAPTAAPVLPAYPSSAVSHKSHVRPSPPPQQQHNHHHRDEQTAAANGEGDRVIYFRKLVAEDVDQVRELHETWFPIRYNQSFYDGAVMGLWMETGGPLFAQLAVEVAPPASASTPSYNANVYNQCMAPRPQHEYILGAVTASTLPLAKVEDPDLIASDDNVHTHVMYILTLGSRASVRRKGIASALLQECIDQAWRQPECGAVYLHVKADNVSALRFYEKNGFRNLRYLQGASTCALFWTLDTAARAVFDRVVRVAETRRRTLARRPRRQRRKEERGRARGVSIPPSLVNREGADAVVLCIINLLDEVEGVMQGMSSRKSSFNTPTASTASSTKATSFSSSKPHFSSSRVRMLHSLVVDFRFFLSFSFSRFCLYRTLLQNDIDDLLNMIDDDSEEPATAVHPRSTMTKDSSSSKVSSSRDEFLVGGKKK